ncbi:hypothetical protein EW146_g3394 [Bondarzewia mesenterica]|uniref:non-specific serine/threonine protein kinase n=1 Tax=Bondarzewia mesenterica TaxID=1095465 RepID=A0A4S4LY48_9AGAM|nr:hypothetical protein EW146_g3394 [Bondarzewia mesenterica]
MAPKAAAKYQYVVTSQGPKIIPVLDHYPPPPPMAPRDEESPADYNAGGYLQIQVNDTFQSGRYTIVRKLGQVLSLFFARDDQKAHHSALKVVKSAGRYTETARDEIKLLQQIADTSLSHPGRAHIVSFLDSFSHTSPTDTHVCIIFEPLGENLLSLIEKNRRTGVPQSLVKSIIKQVLLGLQYLHEECDLVHTDIKPENISRSSLLHISNPKFPTPLSSPSVMSIPNVESHILTELSSSPSPQTHKLPIPPARSRRSSATVATHALSRARSVHIVESQPLASPSRSHLHARLRSSIGEDSTSTSESSYSSSLLREGRVMTMTADTTPATSLGSGMSKLQLSSDEHVEPTSVVVPVHETEVDESDSEASHCVPPTASGPSLLTQTAPHNLTASSTAPPPPSRSASPPAQQQQAPFHPISIKIADLGNATPSKKHFTEEIQTRQYRSPEAIIGRTDWGCEVDIWSVACVVFELLTAEYLFEPQSQGQLFSKDDDHMAQIIELLGDIPANVRNGGKYSRELFDHAGALRYIKHLKPWPLERVMREKYLFGDVESRALCAFLEPMLVVDGKCRASAGALARHEWLDVEWEREALSLERCVW